MSPAATMEAVVVAHQGGWDEILLVLLPVAIFVSLLSVAHRRASGHPTGDEVDGTPGPPRNHPGEPPAGL